MSAASAVASWRTLGCMDHGQVPPSPRRPPPSPDARSPTLARIRTRPAGGRWPHWPCVRPKNWGAPNRPASTGSRVKSLGARAPAARPAESTLRAHRARRGGHESRAGCSPTTRHRRCDAPPISPLATSWPGAQPSSVQHMGPPQGHRDVRPARKRAVARPIAPPASRIGLCRPYARPCRDARVRGAGWTEVASPIRTRLRRRAALWPTPGLRRPGGTPQGGSHGDGSTRGLPAARSGQQAARPQATDVDVGRAAPTRTNWRNRDRRRAGGCPALTLRSGRQRPADRPRVQEPGGPAQPRGMPYSMLGV